MTEVTSADVVGLEQPELQAAVARLHRVVVRLRGRRAGPAAARAADAVGQRRRGRPAPGGAVPAVPARHLAARAPGRSPAPAPAVVDGGRGSRPVRARGRDPDHGVGGRRSDRAALRDRLRCRDAHRALPDRGLRVPAQRRGATPAGRRQRQDRREPVGERDRRPRARRPADRRRSRHRSPSPSTPSPSWVPRSACAGSRSAPSDVADQDGGPVATRTRLARGGRGAARRGP